MPVIGHFKMWKRQSEEKNERCSKWRDLQKMISWKNIFWVWVLKCNISSNILVFSGLKSFAHFLNEFLCATCTFLQQNVNLEKRWNHLATCFHQHQNFLFKLILKPLRSFRMSKINLGDKFCALMQLPITSHTFPTYAEWIKACFISPCDVEKFKILLTAKFTQNFLVRSQDEEIRKKSIIQPKFNRQFFWYFRLYLDFLLNLYIKYIISG